MVIGSAFRSRNIANPFSWEERKAMIELTLTDEEKARVDFLPVRDYFDDHRWNLAVMAGVKELTRVHGKTVIVGFQKDQSSYYLENFSAWSRIEVKPKYAINATDLRAAFFQDGPLDSSMKVLEPYVDPAVLGYLKAWSRLSLYRTAAREQAAVIRGREKWGVGPFLTGDAVVTVTVDDKQYILLVKRKEGAIGEGLWALPGGHLNPGERFYDGAVRELDEETQLKLLAGTMRNALKDQHVFDHPLRSPRARVITGAFHFHLGHMSALPEVKGSDDVDEARWTLVKEELPALEDKMFDDHAAVIDRFVDLFPEF